MIVNIYNDVLTNPDQHVREVLDLGFEDFIMGGYTLKSIKDRGRDKIAEFLLAEFPKYSLATNHVRQSPKGQKDPNFIHSDEVMGDLTAITYLNKDVNSKDGTTLYDDSKNPMCILKAAYNRMVVFDCPIKHGRNIRENDAKKISAGESFVFGQCFELLDKRILYLCVYKM